MASKPIATKKFGRSNRQVTVIGLGGEGVLRTYGRAGEARSVIQTAITEGICYFDSARVYSDSEVYYGSVWQEQPADRNRMFQASKSASRRREDAEKDLDATLDRIQTGFLDLWQIHDLRTEQDFATVGGPGGALETFSEAKAAGRIGAIGVTGHHDPNILTRAVQEWPVDAVMMPVNPAEAVLGGVFDFDPPCCKRKRDRRYRDEDFGRRQLSSIQQRRNTGIADSIRPFKGHYGCHRGLRHPRRGAHAFGHGPGIRTLVF